MFEIKWTASARTEYFENLDYWINRNKSVEYSLKIVNAVEKMEDLLSEKPKIGRSTNKKNQILKVVVLREFYIYYKIENDIVNILAFKGAKQDYKKHTFGI